jgi:hypothetical protein
MNAKIFGAKQIAALVILAVGSIFAAPLDKFYDFDSPPDITFWNSTGQPDLSVFSFSNGFMEQRTYSVNESAGFTYPDITTTGGDLTPTNALIMEARINVHQINGGSGITFQAFDGAHRYTVGFRPTGIGIPTSSGDAYIDLDVFGFHTYRLESPANSSEIRFYFDGTLVLVTNAPSYT